MGEKGGKERGGKGYFWEKKRGRKKTHLKHVLRQPSRGPRLEEAFARERGLRGRFEDDGVPCDEGGEEGVYCG